jgi:hypothetical protein
MNPFTAAVAGGALTLGNKKPRRPTARKGQCQGRDRENGKNEDQKHQSDIQDETAGRENEKRDVRDCVIL